MTTPVISEFRRLYPEAKLTLIVGGATQAALMANSSLIDQIVEIPGGTSRRAILKFLFGLRKQKIDVAFIGTRIWLQGLIPWGLRILSRVPVIVGDSGKTGLRFPYRVRGNIDPNEHRVDRMLNTFALWSGQPPASPRFSIECSPAGMYEATSVLESKGLSPGRFVLFHPGSSAAPKQREKRVPVDVARRIARGIIDQEHDMWVAFMFGPEDAGLLSHFEDLGPRTAVISGCSVPTTVAILSHAAGFIGSDSGLGHVAAALGVPTITLIGPTVPSETAPYGARATTIQRLEQLDCQPCWGSARYGRCPFGVRCMHEVPETAVVAQVETWFSRSD